MVEIASFNSSIPFLRSYRPKNKNLSIWPTGLISLLKPFDWQSTIITYLKQDMLDYLDAPVPYLIGISTDIFK